MSVESNKDVVRRFYEGFNRRDVEAIVGQVADDFVNHTVEHGRSPDREGLRQGSTRILAAFPDLLTTVELLVAEGDLVTAVHTHEGVHDGPFPLMDLPATGKRFRINGIEVFRVVDGKITDFWGRDDTLGLLLQVGLVPLPGQ